MLKVVFSTLFLIFLSFLYKDNAHACSSTDLSFALSIPSDIKVCQSYIGGNNGLIKSYSESNLGTQDWIGNPKDRFYLADKYNYFKKYETVLFRKRRHCSYNTHSLIGTSENNGKRECHIAFEESFPLPSLIKGNQRSRILETLDKDYKLISEEKEIVESDFGNTYITMSEYCGNNKENSKLITIAVDESSKPYIQGDNYEIYQSQKKRPLQHLVFMNEACDTPTE